MHWYVGRSQAEIAASLGLDRKTGPHVHQAGDRGGVHPGRPAGGRAGVAGAGAGVVPVDRPDAAGLELAGDRGPARAGRGLAGAGVNLATIHQRLRDEHALAGSESSLHRYVAASLARRR